MHSWQPLHGQQPRQRTWSSKRPASSDSWLDALAQNDMFCWYAALTSEESEAENEEAAAAGRRSASRFQPQAPWTGSHGAVQHRLFFAARHAPSNAPCGIFSAYSVLQPNSWQMLEVPSSKCTALVVDTTISGKCRWQGSVSLCEACLRAHVCQVRACRPACFGDVAGLCK